MRRGDELARQRRELPWVPIEKEYVFETDDGAKTLAELFDGRSQLLVYHFMFGPADAEPGCPANSSSSITSTASSRTSTPTIVTMVVDSLAPLEELHPLQGSAWAGAFPWVSSVDTDFKFDFGACVHGGAAAGVPPSSTRCRRSSTRTRSHRDRPIDYLAEGEVSVFALEDGVGPPHLLEHLRPWSRVS